MPDITREDLIKAARIKEPALKQYDDDTVAAAIGQKQPELNIYLRRQQTAALVDAATELQKTPAPHTTPATLESTAPQRPRSRRPSVGLEPHRRITAARSAPPSPPSPTPTTPVTPVTPVTPQPQTPAQPTGQTQPASPANPLASAWANLTPQGREANASDVAARTKAIEQTPSGYGAMPTPTANSIGELASDSVQGVKQVATQAGQAVANTARTVANDQFIPNTTEEIDRLARRALRGTATLAGKIGEVAANYPTGQFGLPKTQDEINAQKQAAREGASEIRDLVTKPAERHDIDAVEALGLRLEETPQSLVPFLGGAVAADEAAQVLNSAKRVEAGQGTDDDQRVLASYMAKREREIDRESRKTLGAKVADVASQLPAFGTEFAATGPVFRGAKVGTQALLRPMRRALIQSGTTTAKQAVTRLASKGTSAAAGVLVQAAVNPQLYGPKFIENLTPQLRREADSARVVVDGPGDGVMESLYNAFADTAIEVGSERTGFMLGKLTGVLGKIPGAQRAKAMKAAAMQRWLGRHPDKGPTAFEKLLSQVGYHGVLGEMFEERVGDVSRLALGIEGGQLLPSREQFMVEAIAFAIPGVANQLNTAALHGVESVQRNRAINEIAKKTGMSHDDVTQIVNGMQNDNEPAPQPTPIPTTPAPQTQGTPYPDNTPQIPRVDDQMRDDFQNNERLLMDASIDQQAMKQLAADQRRLERGIKDRFGPDADMVIERWRNQVADEIDELAENEAQANAAEQAAAAPPPGPGTTPTNLDALGQGPLEASQLGDLQTPLGSNSEHGIIGGDAGTAPPTIPPTIEDGSGTEPVSEILTQTGASVQPAEPGNGPNAQGPHQASRIAQELDQARARHEAFVQTKTGDSSYRVSVIPESDYQADERALAGAAASRGTVLVMVSSSSDREDSKGPAIHGATIPGHGRVVFVDRRSAKAAVALHEEIGHELKRREPQMWEAFRASLPPRLLAQSEARYAADYARETGGLRLAPEKLREEGVARLVESLSSNILDDPVKAALQLSHLSESFEVPERVTLIDQVLSAIHRVLRKLGFNASSTRTETKQGRIDRDRDDFISGSEKLEAIIKTQDLLEKMRERFRPPDAVKLPEYPGRDQGGQGAPSTPTDPNGGVGGSTLAELHQRRREVAAAKAKAKKERRREPRKKIPRAFNKSQVIKRLHNHVRDLPTALDEINARLDTMNQIDVELDVNLPEVFGLTPDDLDGYEGGERMRLHKHFNISEDNQVLDTLVTPEQKDRIINEVLRGNRGKIETLTADVLRRPEAYDQQIVLDAFLYDHANNSLQEVLSDQESVKASKLNVGDRFTIHGAPFEVVEQESDGQVFRFMRELDETGLEPMEADQAGLFQVFLDELDTVPVDQGSLKSSDSPQPSQTDSVSPSRPANRLDDSQGVQTAATRIDRSAEGTPAEPTGSPALADSHKPGVGRQTPETRDPTTQEPDRSSSPVGPDTVVSDPSLDNTTDATNAQDLPEKPDDDIPFAVRGGSGGRGGDVWGQQGIFGQGDVTPSTGKQRSLGELFEQSTADEPLDRDRDVIEDSPIGKSTDQQQGERQQKLDEDNETGTLFAVRQLDGRDVKVKRDPIDVAAERDNLGFRSGLLDAIRKFPKPQSKMSAAQFKGWLSKQPGVKDEEISWTGLDEYVQSKQKLTAQEAAEYVAKNRVQLEEVVLGYDARAVEQHLRHSRFDTKIEQVPDGYRLVRSGINMRTFPSREAVEAHLKERSERYIAEKNPPKYAVHTLPGGTNYREVLLTFPKGAPFSGDHFERNNILAHARVNDRVTKEGKRVLFLEEVQSDWHQQGRKRGYDERLNPNQTPSSGYLTPDAPFKTTWPTLVLKRMIQDAVEHGYDQLAWTTGTQQNERYSLSKYIDTLEYERFEEDGVFYELSATKDGKEVISEKTVREDELDETLGADLAEHVRAGRGDSLAKERPLRPEWKRLKLGEIEMGGDGMRGFYDNMLVKAAGKLGKKFNARPRRIDVITGTNHDKPWRVFDKVFGNYVADFATEREAKEFVGNRTDVAYEHKSSTASVHGLTITPELRAFVQEQGQVMFAVRPGESARYDDNNSKLNSERRSHASTASKTRRANDQATPARDSRRNQAVAPDANRGRGGQGSQRLAVEHGPGQARSSQPVDRDAIRRYYRAQNAQVDGEKFMRVRYPNSIEFRVYLVPAEQLKFDPTNPDHVASLIAHYGGKVNTDGDVMPTTVEQFNALPTEEQQRLTEDMGVGGKYEHEYRRILLPEGRADEQLLDEETYHAAVHQGLNDQERLMLFLPFILNENATAREAEEKTYRAMTNGDPLPPGTQVVADLIRSGKVFTRSIPSDVDSDQVMFAVRSLFDQPAEDEGNDAENANIPFESRLFGYNDFGNAATTRDNSERDRSRGSTAEPVGQGDLPAKSGTTGRGGGATRQADGKSGVRKQSRAGLPDAVADGDGGAGDQRIHSANRPDRTGASATGDQQQPDRDANRDRGVSSDAFTTGLFAAPDSIRPDDTRQEPVVDAVGTGADVLDTPGTDADATASPEPAESGRSRQLRNESVTPHTPPTSPPSPPTPPATTNAEPSPATTTPEPSSAEAGPPADGIIPGDRANIDQHLPMLFPEQRGDVVKAENRFFQQNKRGILFTNATGTGKTYTGLGIARRMIDMGRPNGIVVVPSEKKAVDWIEDGENVGVELHQLTDSKDAKREGQAVITTYANFHQNDALNRRRWDWLVFDESHYLGSEQSDKPNQSRDRMRYLTAHGQKAFERGMEFSPLAQAMNEHVREHLRGIGLYKSSPQTVEKLRRGDRLTLELRGLDAELAKQMAEAHDQVARIAREIHDQTKVVFLSATPFAYVLNVDYAQSYLFDYSQAEGTDPMTYNAGDGREQFFMSNFGYRMRYNKLTRPESGVDANLMERQFYQKLVKSGAVSGRALDIPHDYSRQFVLLDDAIGKKIDDGLQAISARDEDGHDRYPMLIRAIQKQYDYHFYNRLLEAIKARHVVGRVKQHLALDRHVVVFHGYKKAYAVPHPFKFENVEPPTGNTVAEAIANKGALDRDIAAFQSDHPDLVKLDMSGLISPIQQMRNAFGDSMVEFNGDVPKRIRRENIDQFNDPTNDAIKVVMVQERAGREGIDLHDKWGGKQRVLINLSLPTAPVAATQIEGRIRRSGAKSDAIYEYPVIGTGFERHAFGTKISQRSQTAENLAMGNKARALDSAFKDGYDNAQPAEPSSSQGTGGKESDAREVEDDPFDQAISLYYGRAKNSKARQDREGKDYYATPEPVGYKMVEWLQPEANERMLEPSAGHGAIARWFPERTTNHAVEQSYQLASGLPMVMQGRNASVMQQTFETLDLHNKYDGIAMNPPFGHGGKTAMEHVAKAFRHLNTYGRLIAIVPEGSFNKHFETWRDDKASRDAHVVAEVSLPTETFKRAGTTVKTKMLVIDNRADKRADDGTVLPATRHYNIFGDNIEEIFESIRDVALPDRVRNPIPTPATPASTSTATPTTTSNVQAGSGAQVVTHRHTKRNVDIHLVTWTARLDRDQFDALRREAKSAGGYYSRKWGNSPAGFAFDTQEKAQAFAAKHFDAPPQSPPQTNPDAGNNDDIRFAVRPAAEAGVPESAHANTIEKVRQLWEEKGTDSPHFKRWFKGSKVVDEQGKPMVVYHGSEKAGFTTFEIDDHAGKRAFFTDTPSVAATYHPGPNHTVRVPPVAQTIDDIPTRLIEIDDDNPDYRYELSNDEGAVIEAAATEDEIVDAYNRHFEYGGKFIEEPGRYDVYLSIKNPYIVDAKGRAWDDVNGDGFETTNSIVTEAMEGYYGDDIDGVIFKNIIDEGPHGNGGELPATVYVAFDPSQIKSATDNRGTFDQFEEDIRFAVRNNEAEVSTTPTGPHRLSLNQALTVDQTPALSKRARQMVDVMREDASGSRMGVRSIVEFMADSLDLEIRERLEQLTSKQTAEYQSSREHLLRTKTSSHIENLREGGRAMWAMLEDQAPGQIASLVGERLLEVIPGGQNNPNAPASLDEAFGTFFLLSVIQPRAIPIELRKRIYNHMETHNPEFANLIQDLRATWQAHQSRDARGRFNSYMRDVRKKKTKAQIKRSREDWRHRMMYNITAGTVIQTRVFRPIYKSLARFDEKLAIKFENEAKGTSGDPTPLYHRLLHVPMAAGEMLWGSDRGREGIRLPQWGNSMQLDSESKKLLTDAGFELPEPPGHGQQAFLTDYTIGDVVRDVGEENMEAFETYGQAKAAVVRFEKRQHAYPGMSAGITVADLKDIVRRDEAANPNWVKQFDRINGYMDQLVLIGVYSGEITPDQAVAIKQSWTADNNDESTLDDTRQSEGYWPLLRNLNGGARKPVAGSRGTKPTVGLYKSFGSEIEFAGLIDALQYRVTQALYGYYENHMLLSIRNLAHSVDEQTADQVPLPARAAAWRLMTPLELDWKKVADLNEREMQEVIASDINAQRAAKQGVELEALPAHQKIKPEEVVISFPGIPVWRQVPPKAVRIVAPWVNGQRQFFQINDPILFEFFAKSDKPRETIRALGRYMGQAVRPWKRAMTQNFGFAVSSVIRDIPTAVMLGEGKASMIPAAPLVVGIWNRWTKKHHDAMQQTELLSRAYDATSSKAHRKLREKFADVLTQDIVVDNYANMSGWQKVVQLPKQAYAAYMKHSDMFNFMTGGRALSQFVEGATREGAFILAKQRGESDLSAQRQYDTVSGFFAERPGHPILRSWIGAAGFMNASVQTAMQLWTRGVSHNRAERQGFYMRMGVLGSLGMITALINYLLMDDDDRLQRSEQSEETRLRYMAIKIPGTKGWLARLPFDYGAGGAIMSFGYNLTEGQLLADPVNGYKTATFALERAIDMPGISDILGPHITTYLELKNDRSFFRDDTIVPAWMRTFYPDAPDLWAYPDTPDIYRKIGSLTGTSPIQVEYLNRGFFGSTMDDIMKLGRQASDGRLLPDDLADAPIFGRLVHREAKGRGSQSVRELRDMADAYNVTRTRLKNLKESGKIDQARYRELSEKLNELEPAKRMWKQLDQLHRKTKELDPKRDAKRIADIERRMTALGRQMIETLEKNQQNREAN